MDFTFLAMMVLLTTPRVPRVVVLPIWIDNCGRGQPISMRDCRRGTISLAQMKRLESLASAAEDMMNLMICEIVRTGPLCEGTG